MSETYKKISGLLQSPAPDARGLTRWWWYGCCVDRSEIERELDYMKEAHIGGVELQILYPVTPDNSAKSLHNVPYGSPEFYDILRFTAQACAARGMTLDITPGSSWPFGGPTVAEEDAQQEAIPYQLDVHGPVRFSCDLTTRIAGTVCAAVMGKMENCIMLPETVVDITDKFQIRELFGWPWGTELAEIEIPEGDWKICFFVISQHRNHVGKPSRGADGLVIDHCSRRAADRFMEQMIRPIMERVPGIHALFCDSIEVEGHNWSSVLLKEFQSRRGYDLTPYVYALWGDMGEITAHVRYDHFKTMSELTIENFFDPFTEFSHKHGALSRVQAHGTWGDILRVYASADIPEGETFGDHRTLRVNTIHRRLAASAGHIYGRELISNETFTWLKRPRFTETLEELKAAVDAVFLDGMNMIVNHGYAYSPEGAGKRGWPFYASTHINHTAPWWPLYGNLGAYINRASALLRFGHHVAEVAIYLPQADIYADSMLSELHLAMRLDEHLDNDAMDAVQKAGYWFDYVNDEALCSLGKIEDGRLTIQKNSYRVILLIGCSRLPIETAQKLAEFSRTGGILICDRIPNQSCGLVGYRENAKQIQNLMAAAAPILVPDRKESLIRELKSRFVPDVTVSHPDKIGYVHRADGNTHLYFLSNLSDDALDAQIKCKDRTEPVRAWSVNSIAPVPVKAEGDCLPLHFCAHESIVLVFAPDLIGAPICPEICAYTQQKALENWTLTLEGKVLYSEQPFTWDTVPEFTHYSGTGVYECTFDMASTVTHAKLCLSELFCAARVYLNQVCIGDIWTHPLELECTDQIRKGPNHLRIEVCSTLINEMMTDGSYDACPEVLDEWPYFGAVINAHRKARLNCMREFLEQPAVLPCGLRENVIIKWRAATDSCTPETSGE
ncbi:MAG: hypothetical protein IJW70_01780 [Clostridia bacterium]|nr:hypothetical protein [Clostridia bacterium]